jgi:hypothetical protein
MTSALRTHNLFDRGTDHFVTSNEYYYISCTKLWELAYYSLEASICNVIEFTKLVIIRRSVGQVRVCKI